MISFKLFFETTDNRYLVIFGSLKTGLTKDIYVAAKDKAEALHLAKIKINDEYPEFHHDHHYIIQKPWDNNYLRAIDD